jgi:hypothetical protein
MFIYDDLMSRKGFGVVKDFCEIAHELQLLDHDEEPIRDIYITTSAWDDLGLWPSTLQEAAITEFQNFLTGEILFWGDLRHGNHLKPLDPSFGWVEFKIRTDPQVRVYGAFLSRDFFLAISADYRKTPPTAHELQIKWEAFWGEDAFRMGIQTPDDLMTNYRVAK